ncbi:MAG: class I SAM-dependent methyltransferase [Desulfovibrionaceae bacterium]|nr:class I SAM-dependent methyltransferase [Desulfovibrionaceae bacterium]
MDRIQHYWSRRAAGFGQVRQQELCSDKPERWWAEIGPYLPRKAQPLDVLDVGTGAGFLAILLARHGCTVTAVDSCPHMLDEAAALARAEGCTVTIRQMNADALRFADRSFDCVLARNVTWTLLDPGAAYTEWWRVLRPGGVLLNFDANYGAVDFTGLRDAQGQHAHADIEPALLQEGENIRRELPLSREDRPRWDMDILRGLGASPCVCDTEISGRVFARQDASFNPVPMFALRATRADTDS